MAGEQFHTAVELVQAQPLVGFAVVDEECNLFMFNAKDVGVLSGSIVLPTNSKFTAVV